MRAVVALLFDAWMGVRVMAKEMHDAIDRALDWELDD